MKKYLLYAGIGLAALLVVVGVGGGTAWLIASKITPVTVQSASSSAGPADVKVTKDNKFELKEFVTNLADTDQKRYVKISLALIGIDTRETERVKENEPLIRDTIVGLLNGKKAQEITGEKAAASLKSEIETKLNTALGGKPIQKVLITDFVVQ